MRPLEEILQDGSDDELADWCETYGPSRESEKPVYEFFLSMAAASADDQDTEIADFVRLALDRGATWAQVAEVLGMSVERAADRFADATGETTATAGLAGHRRDA